ncbi:endonuclease/exonuclease/phosphatase family protein [Kribbella sp. NPDC051137]|uniref:endonuclease/exonuclease/phosphatase family protein n=1 Tax=Kribbella sp. NPDC051137 TaxID=3155045 RepID=UPI00341EE73F
MRITVLTLNVQRRTASINAELRRLAPDLVALQEVGYSSQLAELTDGTGLQHTTHQAGVIDLPSATDGSVFASRWPHRVVEILDHRPSSDSDCHWWTLGAAVDVPGLGELLVILPTTPWQLDQSAAREDQLIAVADLDARRRRALPTIIAGDFNAAPDSAGIRFLSGLQSLDGRSTAYFDAWATAGEGPGHTWTTNNPLGAQEIDQLLGQSSHHRRIDYVFVGTPHAHPHARARIVNTRLVGLEKPFSDHYGVLAELDVTLA